MPTRTAKQILAEWHELAMQRSEVTDSDLADGLAARIEQLRREYIEGTPPEAQGPARAIADDDEPKIQMRFDWSKSPAGTARDDSGPER